MVGSLMTGLTATEEKTLGAPEVARAAIIAFGFVFIHPFLDGNGRMGRLWQTLILMQKYPLFEYLPFETLISKDQEKYYNALSECDKVGKSTKFIEYMLSVIDLSISELLIFNNRTLKEKERLEYFISLNKLEFTRKDYMDIFSINNRTQFNNTPSKWLIKKITDLNGNQIQFNYVNNSSLFIFHFSNYFTFLTSRKRIVICITNSNLYVIHNFSR